MFDFTVKEEDILMKLTTTRPVATKEVIANFLGNILTRAGGDIADKVNLILTKDTLFLEYKGHAAIGYAEETRKVEEINLNNLKAFTITTKDKEEAIEIKTKSKEFLLVRNNADEDNLALAMSNVIEELKTIQ